MHVAAQTGCRAVGVEGNKDEHNTAVALQQAFNAKVHQLSTVVLVSLRAL